MKDHPPILSIIYVNYNSSEYLRDSLTSIYRDMSIDLFEVIIVNNSPSDFVLEEWLRQFQNITFIQNTENIGFPRANNKAFSHCRGKLYLLLNPDTVIQPGSLTNLITFMLDNKQVGVVGPQFVDAKENFQPSAFGHPTVIGTIRQQLGLSAWSARPEDGTQEVDWISGACLMVRSDIIRQVAGLDENLFWIEDADLCIRIQQLGWKVYYLPEARIIHFGEGSAKTNVRLKIRRQYLNKVGFFKKYSSRWEQCLLKLFIFIEVLTKLIIRIVQWPFTRGDLIDRIQGYWDVEIGILTGKNW
ncbi:MAG: glycosyltransferase family 2 protein [Chloroflexi bacterium]|nr:glycosyltransferase family 2 protein [Chloroflexota bacterium]